MNKFRQLLNRVELHEYQAHATKWQAFKYRVGIFLIGKVFRWAVVLGAFGAVGYATFMFGAAKYPVTVYAEKPVDISLEEKIDEFKAELLATLKKCESQGHKEDDGLIILDTNNKASIGLFQFQITTVQHYEKLLHNREVTRKQAIEIALDEKEATQLASDIIFTTKNGVAKDWVLCSAKHGLTAQLQTIKKLEN